MKGKKISIKINQGVVIGRKSNLPNGNSYFYFKGIPYAQPPIGKLRFMEPQPLERFVQKTLDCSKERNVSFQLDYFNNIVGSEDCLYLNVYTPLISPKKLLPVMVWIHGGAFVKGSGNCDIYGPEFLLQDNIILVTLNYRLGVLGFLSLPEGGIPGNAGLKDQVLALKWIQSNIHYFNGDNKNVTLFGESAGAVSVHFHVHSNVSKNYFHKAIMQSGTFNLEFSMQKNASQNAKRLAALLGCKNSSDHEIAKFLKNFQNLEIFFEVHNNVVIKDEWKRYSFMPIVYSPVIEDPNTENPIIVEDPLISMKKYNSIKIPIVMGYTNSEGILFSTKSDHSFHVIDTDPNKMVPYFLNIDENDPDFLQISTKIRNFYFGNGKISSETLQNFINLMTDWQFAYGIQNAAENHVKIQPQSSLYFYKFSYDGDRNYFKKFLGLEKAEGASHGDDLFYLFKSDLFAKNENENNDDEKITKLMCKLWTNFAKYGNPTPNNEKDSVNFVWNPVQNDGNLNYLNIDKNVKESVNPDKDRMNFWRQISNSYKENHSKLKLKL